MPILNNNRTAREPRQYGKHAVLHSHMVPSHIVAICCADIRQERGHLLDRNGTAKVTNGNGNGRHLLVMQPRIGNLFAEQKGKAGHDE